MSCDCFRNRLACLVLVSLSPDPALTLGGYHYLYLSFTLILIVTTGFGPKSYFIYRIR